MRACCAITVVVSVCLVLLRSDGAAQAAAVPGLRTWTLSAAPDVRIGGDATPQTTFTRIAVVRAPTGEVVVEDNGSGELRLFSPSGEFIRNLSRRGNGPGEYQSRSLLWRSDDTVFVVTFSPGAPDVYSYTTAGGFRSRMTVRAANIPRAISALGRLTSGRFLISKRNAFTVLDPNLRAGEVSRNSDTLGILTVGDSGGVTWIGTFPAATRITYASPFLQGRATYLNTVLGPFLVTGVSGNQVWLGDSGAGEITIFDVSGSRIRTVAMPTPQRPLNEPAVEAAARRAIAAATNDNARARAEALYAKAARPRTAPRFASFTPGVDGEMWVSLFTEDPTAPTRFLVMDRSGKPVAQAVVPSNVSVAEIGRDYVLGRAIDADGVESVVLYRLVRS